MAISRTVTEAIVNDFLSLERADLFMSNLEADLVSISPLISNFNEEKFVENCTKYTSKIEKKLKTINSKLMTTNTYSGLKPKNNIIKIALDQIGDFEAMCYNISPDEIASINQSNIKQAEVYRKLLSSTFIDLINFCRALVENIKITRQNPQNKLKSRKPWWKFYK